MIKHERKYLILNFLSPALKAFKRISDIFLMFSPINDRCFEALVSKREPVDLIVGNPDW